MHPASTRNIPEIPRSAISAVASLGAINPPRPIPALMVPTARPRQREKKGPIRIEVGRMETADDPMPRRKQNA